MWDKRLSVKRTLLAGTMDVHNGLTWVGPYPLAIVYNGHSKEDFINYLQSDPSIEAFTDWFFAPRLHRHQVSVVCEKTPANAYAIPSALRADSSAKGVFMVRSLSGVSNSLTKRNYSLPYTILRWLVAANIAVNALDTYGPNRVHIIRYEDLIQETEATLSALCNFLEINLASIQEMITLKTSERLTSDPTINGKRGASSSWKNLPSQGISKTSLIVPPLSEDDLLHAKTLTLAPKLMELYSHSPRTLTASVISEHLGYPELRKLPNENGLLEQIKEILMEGIRLKKPGTPVPRFYWEFLTGLK